MQVSSSLSVFYCTSLLKVGKYPHNIAVMGNGRLSCIAMYERDAPGIKPIFTFNPHYANFLNPQM